MKYSEEISVTEKYKEEYRNGLSALIKSREEEAEKIRDAYFSDIFSNRDKYVNDLINMLGWPLTDMKKEAPPKVCVCEKMSDEDGYTIYRMTFEIFSCLKLTGLFFKSGEERLPLVLVQHGALGSPELISDVYGHTDNYNDMLQRVRQAGAHVFAPQLLIWSADHKVPFDRTRIDSQLRRVGSSITAVEIYGMMRILDYFEAQDYVSSFGMVGLSYGGFYSLFTTAIDTRIKAAIPSAYFNTRDSDAFMSLPDWSWFGAAEKFDDAEIACLTYPRKLYIEVGINDNLFRINLGRKAFKKIKHICSDVGTDWVKFIEFEGEHEFDPSDEPIKQLIEDLKSE